MSQTSGNEGSFDDVDLADNTAMKRLSASSLINSTVDDRSSTGLHEQTCTSETVIAGNLADSEISCNVDDASESGKKIPSLDARHARASNSCSSNLDATDFQPTNGSHLKDKLHDEKVADRLETVDKFQATILPTHISVGPIMPAILTCEPSDELVDLCMDCKVLKKELDELRQVSDVQREQIIKLTEDKDEFCDSSIKTEHFETNEEVEACQCRIAELEALEKLHQQQWKTAHEKWVAQDTVIKNTIAQLTKSNEENRREKDNMVMKFALAEQKNIDLTDKVQKLEMMMRDSVSEKETLQTYLTTMRTDKRKLKEILDKRANEVMTLKQDVDKQKELVVAQELKTKWYQNQLNLETESHKNTRSKLAELEGQLLELKEENEKLRSEKQSAIKAHQESIVMKSITSELQLKETKHELETHKHEHTEQQELFDLMKVELETLKKKEKELIEELNTYKDKVRCLNDEHLYQEQTMDRFKVTLQGQKAENKELANKIMELQLAEQQLTELTLRFNELQTTNADMMVEVAASSGRENHHLHCIESLSEQNARLQALNSELTGQLSQSSDEVNSLRTRCTLLQQQAVMQEMELEESKRTSSHIIQSLQSELSQQTKLSEQKRKELEDKDDELKTLKRRHATNVKELMRQLGQLQKRVDAGDNAATSHQSLPLKPLASPPCCELSGSAASDHCGTGQVADSLKNCVLSDIKDDSSYDEVQVDKRKLIAKIVQLQATNAALNNKVEFMQEHATQLMEEVRNKSRIIQDYVMREDTYTLRPSSSSTTISKRPGMLSSMLQSGLNGFGFSTQQSTDICVPQPQSEGFENHLQTVLEETLLKNIQYKENADRLKDEMLRLSHRNKQLEFELHHHRSSQH